MPHAASDAINLWIHSSGETALQQLALDTAKANAILPALFADGEGLYYSSLITLADGLSGISRGYFSWGMVKLYYCAFYATRSLLCATRLAIFYPPNGKPYSLRCVPDASPRKEKGVTHKIVWGVLERELPHNPLLGEIAGTKAYHWMTARREEANYKNSKFPDPSIPPHFFSLDKVGIEKAVATYVADKTMLYSFDPDHAAVVFAIECVKRAGSALSNTGIELLKADHEHVVSCLRAIGIPMDTLTSLLGDAR